VKINFKYLYFLNSATLSFNLTSGVMLCMYDKSRVFKNTNYFNYNRLSLWLGTGERYMGERSGETARNL
jgi:hypothetical protein